MGPLAVAHIGEAGDVKPSDCHWCRITLGAEERALTEAKGGQRAAVQGDD